MKISGNDELSRYINEATINRSQDPAQKPRVEAQTPSDQPKDTVVHLSTRAKEIHTAREALASGPDVRTDKVNDISQKISQGTYEINPEKTAENLLATFIDDLI
ncbi:MAG: flagellar biosynthesis anti-sigma factor FlgM [Deltaproteobacteria bacterium]|nr:flagellar biosynthesis anti-sigma factor FlgM [Deltaproteobacteria bacterium]